MKARESSFTKQDDALIHARFVDFLQRENASLEDVEFFLKNYPTVLPTTVQETHLLQEEFVEYRLLSNEDIPKKVWDEAQNKAFKWYPYHHPPIPSPGIDCVNAGGISTFCC